MSDYVVTAVQGTNADLFPSILKLYVPPNSFVLDMTWGNGVFWKKVQHMLWHADDSLGPGDLVGHYVMANDIDPKRGVVHYDFRHFPEGWTSTFNAVVLDPPYLYTGGFRTMKDSIDRGYNNKARNENGINGVAAVDKMYLDGIQEAHRVLRPKGVLILKCMDQVMSGKQVWAHVEYSDYAMCLGFLQEDLFVLVQNGQPTMRHRPEQQKHARRNHSYFLVFRKEKR